MSYSQSRLSIFLGICLFTCAVAEAGVAVIVSSPPPAREVVIEPPGYARCFMVEPGFYHGVWHYQHRVCEYNNDSGSGAWVAGYWQCIGFRAGGICARWNWAAGHWANGRDIGYRRGWHSERFHYENHRNRDQHGHNRYERSNQHEHSMNRYERGNRSEHGHVESHGHGNWH